MIRKEEMEGGRRKMVFCLREEVLICERSIFIQHQRMDGIWPKLFPLTLPRKDGKLKLFREVWASSFNKVVTTFCLRPQSHRKISVRKLWLKLRQLEKQEQLLILIPINSNIPNCNLPEFRGSLHSRHLEYYYIKWIWIFPLIKHIETAASPFAAQPGNGEVAQSPQTQGGQGQIQLKIVVFLRVCLSQLLQWWRRQEGLYLCNCPWYPGRNSTSHNRHFSARVSLLSSFSSIPSLSVISPSRLWKADFPSHSSFKWVITRLLAERQALTCHVLFTTCFFSFNQRLKSLSQTPLQTLSTHPARHQDWVQCSYLDPISVLATSSNHLRTFRTSDTQTAQAIKISAAGPQAAIFTKMSKVFLLRN